MLVTARTLLRPGGIFPEQMRDLPGGRWTRISLRTLHLLGICGLGAAYLYPVDPALWYPYLLLTLFSGFLLGLSEAWNHGIWLIQLRGLAVLAKVIILLLALLAEPSLVVLMIVVGISGVIAHAPGKVRYYSPLHGRVYGYDDWAREYVGIDRNEEERGDGGC